jgi:hypothetical protein
MLTLNGHSALHASVYLPRNGVWQADLRVDSIEDIVGAVVLDVDEGRLILRGTVVQGGLWQDTGSFRVLGGAGGLRLIAKPKHYTSASLRVVLSDLLAGAGERLSVSSDPDLLKRQVTAWTTVALPTGRLITQLLASTGAASWRVLPDGTVWVGQESWPDSGLTADDFQVLAEDPSRAEAILGVETPLLMPGTTLGGRRVSYVEHRFGQPETRISVWFEGLDGGGDDRMKAAIRRVVRSAQAPIDYLALYIAEVVSQAGSTIDVKPTDPRIPSMAAVPLFAGVPQWKLQTNAGGRVLVGWSGGDPTQPYALAFNADVTAAVVKLLASRVTIGDDTAPQPTMLGSAYRTAEDTFLDAIVTALAAALGGVGLIPPATALTAAQGAFHAAASTYLTQNVRVS